MPINQGLSHLSDHFLMVALLLYFLAVLAFAADFAFGRRGAGTAEVAEPAELVAAGVTAPAAEGTQTAGADGAAAGPTALAVASTPAAGAPGTGTAGPASAAPGKPGILGRRAGLPAGPWVRAGLGLTILGLALHIVGVITRGLAVHRVPWGDMYEFVIAVSCVAVIFFVGLMIKYRPYYLGLFVMAPIVIIIGLAQTVIYTPAGPIAVALNSYWLAIHVTAITLASGTYVVAAVLAVVFLFADRHSRRVAAAAQPGTDRPAGLPHRGVRLPAVDLRHHGRGHLGGPGLGPVLGLGPHRNLGLHHLGGVRMLPARPGHRRVARPPGRLHPAGWVRLPAVQPAGGQHLRHRPALVCRAELSPPG
jgi:cytochrome c assembly protein